jgi:hypothetical protein
LESTPGANLAGNGVSVNSGLAKELDALGSDAEQGDQDYRLDLLTFVSFDLVGSTALKQRRSDWPKVVEFFYATSARLAATFIGQTHIWKFLGDEILLFTRIESTEALADVARKAFHCLRAIIGELSREYGEDLGLSVKGIIWIAPVQSEIDSDLSSDLVAAHRRIIDAFPGDDIVVDDYSSIEGSAISGPLDFLGPNIDAGFRIGHFARAQELVVSPMLGYYLLQKRHSLNDLRIIDFHELKGVGEGTLFPGIWFHENWDSIGKDFTYAHRYRDELIQSVCRGGLESIALLDEVRRDGRLSRYFIDADLLDRIVELSVRSDRPSWLNTVAHPTQTTLWSKRAG